MAEGQHVVGHVEGGAVVVGHDARSVEIAHGQRHHPDAPLARSFHGRGELGAARVIEVAAAGEHHPLGVVVAQDRELRQLHLRAAVRVAHDRHVAGAAGHVLHPTRDLGEVGVHDVAHHHPDDAAAAGDQGAGQRARRVAELPGGHEHALAGGVRNRVRGAVENPRRGGDRHAGRLGHVSE
jgi:hypothetical protein